MENKYDFELDLENENSLSLIIKKIKPNSKVLEFGPANGRLTKYLKEVLSCEVYLVELDQKAGKEALKYAKDIVFGDIEDYLWCDKYEKIDFDFIIFADVLEHLREPLNTIVEAEKLLNDEGSILVSVPNMGHNAVMIDLLNNKLQYNEIGLLDNTHIYFFTKNNLEKMIQDAGMYIKAKEATYASVGDLEIINKRTDVFGIEEKYWKTRPYGEVYQFIYELKKYSGKCVDNIKKNQEYYYKTVYVIEQNEDDVIEMKKNIDHDLEEQTIEINIKKEEVDIVIQPINSNAFIKIVDAYYVLNGVKRNIVFSESNSIYNELDHYLFYDESPVINIRKISFEKLLISYRIINFDDPEIKQKTAGFLKLLEERLRIILETQEEKELLEKKCKLLEKENSVIKGKKAELEARISKIENKKVYKIYKYFIR